MVAGLILHHDLLSFATIDSKHQLIESIELQTSIDLAVMVDFYSGQMGFPIIELTTHRCSFKTGSSTLTFSKINDGTHPHYHFAFNVSEQKISDAEKWLLKRKVEVIDPPTHLKDTPRYSEGIVYFRHWNAHSIFFYDPAGNVVEFIARHTLPDNVFGRFQQSDIYYISEIGLVTDDVRELSSKISTLLQLPKYIGQLDYFSALGDERGLILCFRSGERAVFRKGRKRQTYRTDIILMDCPSSICLENDRFRF